MIRLIPLLLLLSACSPEEQAASQTEYAKVVGKWQDLGQMCIRSGQGYRDCDHMCWNAADDRNKFDWCIQGARAELACRARREVICLSR